MPTGQGSIRLFRFSGIDVFLHWSWFFLILWGIRGRAGGYSSIKWTLVLFFIVLLHEFGHALACRQVGGRANRIVLWPLGGVAYVDPPPRPGATLWSIAAGPLVNVALLPIFGFLAVSTGLQLWSASGPNVDGFLPTVFWINAGLLAFNILPIYPLDGGQIFRCLLWFVIGRARSLMIAAAVGLLGVAAFIGVAFLQGSLWYGALAAFVLLNCWGGLKHAQALLRMAKLPRRLGYSCPACKTSPPVGAYWKCSNCGQAFDTFETMAVCPRCHTQFPTTTCLDCGRQSPVSEWMAPTLVAPDTTLTPQL